METASISTVTEQAQHNKRLQATRSKHPRLKRKVSCIFPNRMSPRLNVMSRSVFLVIDVLNDFFRNQALSSRRTELVSAINQLVQSFRDSGQPIIWI